MHKTIITLENEAYGQTIQISVPGGDLTLEQIRDSLVRPLLTAAGYDEKAVIEAIGPLGDDGVLTALEEKPQ